MNNIIHELTSFYTDTGEYPTHLLITQKDYDKIMLDNGVKTHGKIPFKKLYSTEIIISDCPVKPRFLKLNLENK